MNAYRSGTYVTIIVVTYIDNHASKLNEGLRQGLLHSPEFNHHNEGAHEQCRTYVVISREMRGLLMENGVISRHQTTGWGRLKPHSQGIVRQH